MALARDTGSLIGTNKPFFSWITVSRQPGASVVIIGLPVESASSVDRGMPSR
mgnify:CR=1 FL=1